MLRCRLPARRAITSVLAAALLLPGLGIADPPAVQWAAVEQAEAVVYQAFEQNFVQPDAERCRSHQADIERLAELAPQSLTVQWLRVACLRAAGHTRRAERLKDKVIAQLQAQHVPTTEPAIDLHLPLYVNFDARALAGLLGEQLVDVELRLADHWARIDWLALYVDAQGHERRVLFDASARSSAQLRRGVEDMEVPAGRKPWLAQEMEVFPAFWMFQSWRQAEADEALFAAAAATFGGNSDADPQEVRALAAIALASDQGLFRVRHATWLLRQRRNLPTDALSALAQAFLGKGEHELGNQIFETLLPASDARLSDALVLMAALSHHGVVLPRSAVQRDRYLRAYAKRRSAAEADFRFAMLLLDDSLGLRDQQTARQRLAAAGKLGFGSAWVALYEDCAAAQTKSPAAEPVCETARLTEGLQQASRAGNGIATRLLARQLLDQRPSQHRQREALYRLAIAQGDSEAPWYLVSSLNERGAAPTPRWREWLELGVRRGDRYALHAMGALYRFGKGVAADRLQGCFWYERAAELGLVRGMRAFAESLADHGCGLPEAEAREVLQRWLGRAVARGSTGAMVRLARFHEQWGTSADLVSARALFAAAAARKDGEAIARLAWLCEHGIGGPVDAACAFTHYRQWAAADDNGDGLNNLGRMYWNGFGVSADLKQARALFESAIAKGSVHAHCNLGELLLDGDDPTLHARGRDLIAQAAQQRNQRCMLRLGEAYAYGRDGLETSAGRATEWLRAAHALDPKNRDTTRVLADWLSNRDNPQPDLAQAWRLLDTDRAGFCTERAYLHLSLGEPAAAIAALETSPARGRAECDALLATVLTHVQGRDPAALARAEALLAGLPKPLSPEARLARARIALHQGRLTAALDDFGALRGEKFVAHYWLARFCREHRPCPLSAAAAQEAWQRIEALNGADRNNLAWLLATDPLVDAEAARFALGLIESLPETSVDASYMDTLACAQARVGAHTAARASAARALALARAQQLSNVADYSARVAQLDAGQTCDSPE